MTRLEFRGAVSIARPSSAWLMALVASATLWITGQLAMWVMLIQLLAYGFSYYTRHDPPGWCRSPIWLNVGMFGISAVTISQALHGSPAPLSLAYFASLSQGLQLMDARPRKSEFLLVALALFQVILAANLTDSVFFPPMLVIFLFSVTWTLMVHTLRTEAAEAGDAQAAGPAISPSLLRTTLLASGVSLVLALLIFTVLPRMRTGMLRGHMGPSLALAGFSDRVSLGTIGRIRRDDTVVLRVETLQGTAPAPETAYWRGLAFDRFDGRSWAVSQFPGRRARQRLNGSPRFGANLGAGPTPDALAQRIVREPVRAGVLFGAGPVLRVEGPLDHLELDANGGIYFPAGPDERIRYTLWTDARNWGESDLRRDRAIHPLEPGPASERRSARYLALPQFDPAVAQLAREIAGEFSRDSDRLRAIERYLREVGRYTDAPPDMGTDGERSPIESFLLDGLEGHCEYFASAMVVLARSLDMPARLVNGFAGGRVNRIGRFFELTRSDAHAWVEVHYEQAGWVRYDPTPPDLRLRSSAALSLGERLSEIASVIELWWFQRVVDFDSSDQILALQSVWHMIRSLRSSEGSGPAMLQPSDRTWSAPRLPNAPWAWLTTSGLVVALSADLLRRRRSGRTRRALPRAYARALRLLARRGLRRGESTTARAFARQLEKELPDVACACFSRITEAYLAERFGGQSADSRPLESERLFLDFRNQLA